MPAPSVADEVYKASMMLSAPFVRLCPSTSTSCLNELAIAEVMAIVLLLTFFLKYQPYPDDPALQINLSMWFGQR